MGGLAKRSPFFVLFLPVFMTLDEHSIRYSALDFLVGNGILRAD